jgi:hypothetical protein
VSLKETAKLLAEQAAERAARERAEINDVLARAAAQGVELSRDDAARLLMKKSMDDKVEARRRRLEKDDRDAALVFGGTPQDTHAPRSLRVLPSMKLAGPEWNAMVRAYREWTRRSGNADRDMPKGEMLAESHLSRDRLDNFLRAHQISDYRHVHTYLRNAIDTGRDA